MVIIQKVESGRPQRRSWKKLRRSLEGEFLSQIIDLQRHMIMFIIMNDILLLQYDNKHRYHQYMLNLVMYVNDNQTGSKFLSFVSSGEGPNVKILW